MSASSRSRRPPPRRRRSGRPSFSQLLMVLLFGGALFAGGLWLGGRRDGAPLDRATVAPTPTASSRIGPPAETSSEPRDAAAVAPDRDVPVAPRAGGGLVALVIDDLGRSVADVDRLAALGVPITYAVLPFEERTGPVVSRLGEHAAEYLLHLPMQGAEGADPGPGALLAGMTMVDLREATLRALAAVPGAVGVNNHMGSVLSADSEAMDEVMGVLAERDLFFLDSRTTADTEAYSAALAAGVPAAERQVFLDGDLDPIVIRDRFRETLEIAAQRGAAVAIGHPHAATLDVLADEVPLAVAAGYRFVPVSFLLERPVGEPAS